MTERPILYSTPMVQAILTGMKTKTRRVITLQPDEDPYYLMEFAKSDGILTIDYNQGDNNPTIKCPYGKPGDVLWVRETFFPEKYFNGLTEGCFLKYKANYEGPVDWNWKPSIFMPKAAARIWLKITNIKVERLQDITEQSAKAEGVEREADGWKNYLPELFRQTNFCWPTAYHSFQSLWEKINGTDSWELNPWVWVISFKVLSTTGRPAERKEVEYA